MIFEEGSWGRWVQKKFQKYIGFAPCIFHGRGLFSSDTWGLVPYSKPITTVGKSPYLKALNLGGGPQLVSGGVRIQIQATWL